MKSKKQLKEAILFLQERNRVEDKVYEVLGDIIYNWIEPYQDYILKPFELTDIDRMILTDYIFNGYVSYEDENGISYTITNVEDFVNSLIEDREDYTE